MSRSVTAWAATPGCAAIGSPRSRWCRCAARSCSPRTGIARLRQPADLLGLPLLHDGERQDWALWFQAHGVSDLGHIASSGISFDDQTLLIRAAASHQGVALVSETFGPAGTRAGQPGARAECCLAAGVFLLARLPAGHRRTTEDNRLPRLAASRRPQHQRERASSQASNAGAVHLEALVVHSCVRQRAHCFGQAHRVRALVMARAI